MKYQVKRFSKENYLVLGKQKESFLKTQRNQ